MSRPATSRLKVNPPLGVLPALQYLLPAQLEIDATYQRSLATGPSQSLIRKIAMFWNWDLCQPLVVSRRDDGRLYVIDGQHRLEAAKLRGDIAQLPAVVVQYSSAADEAASFVHLNQQRRPLNKLDVFKAAVASGDDEASAITTALTAAGLSIANTTNPDIWKPGQLVNIGGIERAWRVQGAEATASALGVLSAAFKGQRLRYAGTIFPGIAVVCADERKYPSGRGANQFAQMLAAKPQVEWRSLIYAEHATSPNLSRREAAERTLRKAWADWRPSVAAPPPASAPRPAPPLQITPPSDGKRFCDQCDRRVHLNAAALCKSAHCTLRPALAVGR